MKINSLALLVSPSNFEAQVKFYQHTLELLLVELTASRATFQIGATQLTFESNEDFQPYHFALNIPSNQEQEALAWLKERVEILDYQQQEIQDFSNWNAKAIYFYDADKNIVEFIARKDLNNASDQAFGPDSLLNVSEIGVPVDDIRPTFDFIAETTGMDIYDGGFERFCAVGDEEGLFICINKNVKKWFPKDDVAYSAPFKIEIEEKEKHYKLKFKAGQLKLLKPC